MNKVVLNKIIVNASSIVMMGVCITVGYKIKKIFSEHIEEWALQNVKNIQKKIKSLSLN